MGKLYAYDKGTGASSYEGGEILGSFSTGGSSGGLGHDDGFFNGCNEFKCSDKFGEIFMLFVNDSKKQGFWYEKKSQQFLASSQTMPSEVLFQMGIRRIPSV